MRYNATMKWILIIICSITLIFLGVSFFIKPDPLEIVLKEEDIVEEEKKEETIKVILVGDIMLDRGVTRVIEDKEEDFRFPFLKVADYFNQADIVFGNLEGVISDKGHRVGSIYSFRVNPEAIKGLEYANFNVLSLANNHALDYTKTALEDCLTRIKEAGIEYVGAGFNEQEAYSAVIKEVDGTKIGFLAYTDLGPEVWRAVQGNSGIAWISKNYFERIEQDIEKAKLEADILIVSLHSGQEYTQELTSFQTEFSKMAIEAGADIIAGHHPHVVQRHEQYENGWIFYSMGNFIFDQSFSKETMTGQAVEVLIKDKKIKKVTPLKVKINDYFQPEIIDA